MRKKGLLLAVPFGVFSRFGKNGERPVAFDKPAENFGCVRNAYEDAYKTMPRVGQQVKTPDGDGVVTESNILVEKVRVKFDSDGQITQKVYDKKDITFVPKAKKQPQNSSAEEEKNAE